MNRTPRSTFLVFHDIEAKFETFAFPRWINVSLNENCQEYRSRSVLLIYVRNIYIGYYPYRRVKILKYQNILGAGKGGVPL